LSKYEATWPELLPTVLQKLRGVVNDSTGLSPFEMMFGRTPRMALDLVLCDNQTSINLPKNKQANPAKKIQRSFSLNGMDLLRSLELLVRTM